jgi:putative membrane protein
LDSIIETLSAGLPVLVAQLGVTLLLLGLGIGAYMAVTPFHEMRLVRQGNAAGGVVLMGALVALSIPLAATLATSLVTLDILLWGFVAVLVQLLAFLLTAALLRDLRRMIEEGNVAAGCVVAGIQIAVALINAGAMAG